jgi:hypothetical protein
MGISRRSILRNMAFSSRCAKDAMETPGAVASASMRAISADFAWWWALVMEALREVCVCGAREGDVEREWRCVLGFSSIFAIRNCMQRRKVVLELKTCEMRIGIENYVKRFQVQEKSAQRRS